MFLNEQFDQADITENIKAPHYVLLWWESIYFCSNGNMYTIIFQGMLAEIADCSAIHMVCKFFSRWRTKEFNQRNMIIQSITRTKFWASSSY